MMQAPYYGPHRMNYPYAYPFASYQQAAPMQPYWPMHTNNQPSMGNMMNFPPNMQFMPPMPPMPPSMYPTPYPTSSSKTPQAQMPSIMSQFKASDGSIDINKMMNTAGQMMGAVNQLTGMVKGLSGIFKA
ncbi:YppG family protein [Bacillus songklensis]|uniref:YppG family protein n=1 Tax=Bacillus songklensis TaxID=1069116 RepID=A0ABV8B3S5_9BACI